MPYFGKGKKVTTMPYHGAGKKRHHKKRGEYKGGINPILALAMMEAARRTPEVVQTLIKHNVDTKVADRLHRAGVSRESTALAGDLVMALTGLPSRQ
jgi:hypothetical protein